MKRVRILAKMIDHSLLHPTLTDEQLEEGCRLALHYDTASVCIKPYAVPIAAGLLKDSDVFVGAVVGFPHGNSTIELKAAETSKACEDGAVEIDMVINIGKALSGDWDYAAREISAVHTAAREGGSILKVIFENDFLEQNHIIRLCRICSDIGAEYVKTSTGFGFVKQENGMYSYRGATIEHLKLMRQHSSPRVNVKAAGGVRSLEDLLAVRAAGAVRVGATATAAILDEAERRVESGEDFTI